MPARRRRAPEETKTHKPSNLPVELGCPHWGELLSRTASRPAEAFHAVEHIEA